MIEKFTWAGNVLYFDSEGIEAYTTDRGFHIPKEIALSLAKKIDEFYGEKEETDQ